MAENEDETNDETIIGPSKDDISFPKLLLWHLNRLSLLNTGKFYNLPAYERSVRILEIWMRPYQDDEYKNRKKEQTAQWEAAKIEIEKKISPERWASEVENAYTEPKEIFLEMKQEILIELMHRKGLLLMETGEVVV